MTASDTKKTTEGQPSRSIITTTQRPIASTTTIDQRRLTIGREDSTG